MYGISIEQNRRAHSMVWYRKLEHLTRSKQAESTIACVIILKLCSVLVIYQMHSKNIGSTKGKQVTHT